MSYLDVPRLHFAGAFYTGPGTINNVAQNYVPDVGERGGPAIDPQWNPTGVSKTYLQNCAVTSFVNAEGQSWAPEGLEIFGGGGLDPRFLTHPDPLLGARVDSQGPASDLSERFPEVSSSIAKLVDLDPDQQQRSAVFGLWVGLSLPGNVGGFYGEMSVPFIKDIGGRLSPPIPSAWSYNAGCGWQGVIISPVWYGDVSSSAFLTALKNTAVAGAASPSGGVYDGGLAIKLTVDLHRPQPEFAGVEGDNFCFGRAMGSVAPSLQGEPTFHVIGRRVNDVQRQGRPSASWMVRKLHSGKHLLSLDLGNSTLLEVTNQGGPGPGSMGQLLQPDGWSLALASGDALTNMSWGWSGAQTERVNVDKTVVAQIDAGVVSFIVEGDQETALSATELVVNRDAGAQFQEPNNGWYLDVSSPVSRVQQDYQPNGSAADGLIGPTTIRLTAMRWGIVQPHTQIPLTLDALGIHWAPTKNGWGSQPGSTDLDFDPIRDPTTDANGQVAIAIKPSAGEMELSSLRASLGSRCNLIVTMGANSLPVGDSLPPISVVVWERWTAPPVPTWDNSASEILAEYAKIYPGMKSILDISKESIVTQPQNAAAMFNHLNQDPSSPQYMPVTRDLAPSRVGALVTYFDGIVNR